MKLEYRGPQKKPARDYALLGFIIGAVATLSLMVVPTILFNDPGGPCAWPVAFLIGGGIGGAIGSAISNAREWRENRKRKRS